MIIFHGTQNYIDMPLFGYGKKTNDYGLGFYCTDTLDLAYEWACEDHLDGFVYCYEIDVTNLKILNLLNDNYHILNWLAILLKNRIFNISSPIALEAKNYILDNFLIDYRDYDLITGYRADDSYFSFANDFLNNAISLNQLKNAMYFENLGIQHVIKSQKAFDLLKFVSCSVAMADEWYELKNLRDINARRQYLDFERYKRNPKDLFVMNIIDLEIKNNDKRLR